MRIRELLENKEFDDLKFIKKEGDHEGLNFDVVEDLVYFMNHDDDAYRRHLYPAVNNCIECINSNRKTSPVMFKKAVEDCYQQYIKKFPVRDLKDSLEPELFREACKKIHEDTCKAAEEGKFKD